MVALFNTILYQPIYNLLIFFYNIVPGHDIGLAIICLTVLVKLVLMPFSLQAVRSQKALQDLQPKLEELKKKYKDQKEKLAAETMKLYKEQKVNPLSSCLPLLIQFPFLIAVYRAFQVGLTSDSFDLLYSFVGNPGSINHIAFGFLNMAAPSIGLAILAGVAQYIQTQMLSTKKPKTKEPGAKDEGMLANMNKSMQYFMPFMTIIIGMSLPGGLTFYWFLTTALTSVQQKFMFKNSPIAAVEIIPPKNKYEERKAEERSAEETDSPKQLSDKSWFTFKLYPNMQLDFNKIKNLPVETESGISLGNVTNLEIDLSGHNILKYIVGQKKLFFPSSALMIAPSQIIKISDEKIIVEDTLSPSRQKQTLKKALPASLEEATSVNAKMDN